MEGFKNPGGSEKETNSKQLFFLNFTNKDETL